MPGSLGAGQGAVLQRGHAAPAAKPGSPYRFLRHVPVVYVDYPGPASLTQIYGTFNRAMLRLIPSLRTYAEPLTAAMVEFYTMSQVRGLPGPSWGRGLGKSLRSVSSCSVRGLPAEPSKSGHSSSRCHAQAPPLPCSASWSGRVCIFIP